MCCVVTYTPHMASHVIDITHTTHPPAISPLPPHSHTHTSMFRKIEKRERREREEERRRMKKKGKGREEKGGGAQPQLEDGAGDELLLPHALTLPELEEKSPKLHLLQAQAMEEPQGRSMPSSHPKPTCYTWSIHTAW